VKHNHQCYWCEADLVNADTIPKEVVVRRSATVIYWRLESGEMTCCKMATVDHLVEISKGGNNDGDNLVPSCGSCNWRRSGDPEKFRKRMADHPFYKNHT
jgi:hypothetical protein